MSNTELLMAGIKLLIFGMGMVYIFLFLMIYVMKFLEKALRPWANLLEPAAKPAPVRSSGSDNEKMAMAAAAAAALNAAKNGGANRSGKEA